MSSPKNRRQEAAQTTTEPITEQWPDGTRPDTAPERYHLDWPGKRQARQEAVLPCDKIFRPCPEESLKFETTGNLLIEGDNLDALKLLQGSHSGRIKMIYIDPPYNTGKHVLYRDRYLTDRRTLRRTAKPSPSADVSRDAGLFRAPWLSMMFPRLILARKLLSEDGVLFLSIDDNEQAGAKLLCDEVFGAESHLGTMVVRSAPNARDYGHLARMHEYVLFYAKNPGEARTNALPVAGRRFRFKDRRGDFNIHPLYNSNEAFTKENRPNLFFSFFLYPDRPIEPEFFEIGFEGRPGAIEIFPPKSERNKVPFVWRWSRERCRKFLNTEIVGYRTKNGDYRIVQKMRGATRRVRSLLDDPAFSSRRGTADLENLFGRKLAPFPKPVELIKTLIRVGSNPGDIVLDFFAGTGTTGQAVMELAAEEGYNRSFLLVQCPEPCPESSEAFRAGFTTISQLARERIRRVAARIRERPPSRSDGIDTGFRALGIDEFSPDHSPFQAPFSHHDETENES